MIQVSYKNPIYFIAIAFMVVFGLWYGWRGVLAAYLGGFFGFLLTVHTSLEWTLIFSLCNGIQVAVPVIAFRLFKADAALKTVKDIGVFFLFGNVLNILAGGAYGTIILVMAGINHSDTLFSDFGMWVAGDMLLIFLISPVMLSLGTPYMRKNWWAL